MKTFRSQAPRNSFDGICRAFWTRGKGCVRHEASRPAVVETPNTAGENMTKDVVSVLAGSSVRDVAILLLEKRISAVPVLVANLQLLGMVRQRHRISHESVAGTLKASQATRRIGSIRRRPAFIGYEANGHIGKRP
jgi:CBS domain